MSEIERDEGETVEGRDTRVKQRENNFREPSVHREGRSEEIAVFESQCETDSDKTSRLTHNTKI